VAVTERPELTPVAPPPSASRSRRRSLAVLVVLALAIVALLSQGLLHNLNYFKTVDEVLASRESIGTGVIRLEGVVAPHSIRRTNVGTDFVVTGPRGSIPVDASGTPPQLFQANIPVVVVGHFASASSTTFLGSAIMVKHTAAYIAQYPNRVKAPNGSVR